MNTELTESKLQRILDFFSVGTVKKWRKIENVDLKIRAVEELYIDPISKRQISLPKTLLVELCLLWTTHGGYLLVSVSPGEERLALINIKNPFKFLKHELGLLNVSNVANFEDPKFVTCHMYDKYHYLFSL